MKLTAEQIKALGYVETSPGNYSRTPAPVGAVVPSVSKPDQGRRRQHQGVEGRTSGVEHSGKRRFVISLTQHRARLLDSHDNLRAALKPLVDCITADLCFMSDDNNQLVWQYAQVATQGEQGVSVTVEVVN